MSSTAALLRSQHLWSEGNFGDIFAREFSSFTYGNLPIQKTSRRPRLLTTGSIAALAKPGDLLAGVGFKSPSIRGQLSRDLTIWGLRGPLSLEVLKKAGVTTPRLAFLGDPGLKASDIWPKGSDENENGWLVIPHYRHLRQLSSEVASRGDLRLQTPDAHPEKVAGEIRRSEGVISSSLHGIIFAHSYGIPVVALRPPDLEGEFKYEDYAASVNWKIEYADDVETALTMRQRCVIPDIDSTADSILMPPIELLSSLGIIR